MIDPYDRRAVQAVWQRVLAGRAKERTLEEFAEEQLAMELARSRDYARLSRRAPHLRFSLRLLSAQAQAHGRSLRRLYQRRTGRPLWAASAVARQELPIPETLQQMWEEAAHAARNYARAAERWPEEGRLFRFLSEQKARHGRILKTLAGGRT